MVLTLISACGNSENSQSKDIQGTSDKNAADAVIDATDDGLKSSGAHASEDMEDVDEATITIAFYAPRSISSDDVERVESEINKITVPSIQTSVELMPLEQGNWDQQINLMLTGNEQLDLLPTFYYGSTTLTALLSQKQLIPLNELISQYGQDIMDVLPEGYINATTYDGNIYAVPIHASKAGGSFCV